MNNWISVKDRLPLIDVHVLICLDLGLNKRSIQVGFLGIYQEYNHTSNKFFLDDCCRSKYNIEEILYWMPLPEEPPLENTGGILIPITGFPIYITDTDGKVIMTIDSK